MLCSEQKMIYLETEAILLLCYVVFMLFSPKTIK